MAIATRSGPKPAPAKTKAAAAQASKASEAVTRVSTTILEGGTVKGEPVESEVREVKTFVTHPAHTSVSLGYNKNLGNMEMAKVTVMVSMPHYVEEADNAFAQVLDKAKANLDQAIAELNIVGDAVTGAEDASAAGEGQPEPGAEGAADDGEVTPEYIDGADHDTLVQLCEGNPDLGVNADDYTDDDDLREVLKSVIFGDADAQAADAGEPAAEGDQPYTQEMLDAAETDEIKQLWELWEMGKWPPGPEKIARKTAIKKILEKQEAQAG